MKILIISGLLPIAIFFVSCKQEQNNEIVGNKTVLKSWTESSSKEDILKFVESVTNESSESYIEPKDRIAVFDLDGTIICEKPSYSEVAYSIYHLKRMLRVDPNLSNKQPYKAVAEEDDTYLDDSVDIVLTTPFIGYTQEQYTDSVISFFESEIHPKFKINYKDLFYAPMIELVDFLRENEFKVYISSYSQQSFIRSIALHYLDIDEEYGIGSIVDLEYTPLEKDGAFIRQNSFLIKNSLKAEVMEYQTGKKPIFVVGNSGGDLEILEYVSSTQPHMALIIDHDDEDREFKYRNTELLKKAKENKWNVVSMKNDFQTIFRIQ